MKSEFEGSTQRSNRGGQEQKGGNDRKPNIDENENKNFTNLKRCICVYNNCCVVGQNCSSIGTSRKITVTSNRYYHP